MATKRRRCNQCNRFGHYQKTCPENPKNKAKSAPAVKRVSTANTGYAQSARAPSMSSDQDSLETMAPPDPQEQLPDPGGERTAVAAEQIAAVLESTSVAPGDEWGANEPATEWTPEPQPEPESAGASESQSNVAIDGDSPAGIAFNGAIQTVLTMWEVALIKESLRPPEQMKMLVAKAWTDVAVAQGWLRDANDPTIAVILATGLTGATYGIPTYQTYQIAKAEKARKAVVN